MVFLLVKLEDRDDANGEVLAVYTSEIGALRGADKEMPGYSEWWHRFNKRQDEIAELRRIKPWKLSNELGTTYIPLPDPWRYGKSYQELEARIKELESEGRADAMLKFNYLSIQPKELST